MQYFAIQCSDAVYYYVIQCSDAVQYYVIQWTVVECCPFQHTSTDSHGVLSEREKGSLDLLVMVYSD